MWTETTSTGKTRLCERYIDPLTGKTRKATITLDHATKAALKAGKEALEAKIEKLETQYTYQDITLKELSKKYLTSQKREVKPSSYLSTEHHIGYILDILGEDTIVSRLTAGYVSERITSKSNTPCMTNRNILYFKAMINWAYKHDYVTDRQWLDKVTRVKAPEPSSRMEDHYLETEELRKLIRAMPREDHKLMTRFLALSGLRIGEAVALLDQDVGDYITISKTYSVGCGTYSTTPKTKSSARKVFVQPELAEVIRQIRAYRLKVQMRTGKRNDIFFPNADGDKFRYDYYEHRIRKYSIAAIGRPASPHMLRHTHVSILAEKGIPLDVISARLGHKDSAITRNVYLHITQKKKRQDESLLSQVKIL